MGTGGKPVKGVGDEHVFTVGVWGYHTGDPLRNCVECASRLSHQRAGKLGCSSSKQLPSFHGSVAPKPFIFCDFHPATKREPSADSQITPSGRDMQEALGYIGTVCSDLFEGHCKR